MAISLLTSCREQAVTIAYQGANLSKEAQIIRDKETKKATLRIETKGKWQLFGGLSVETIDLSKPLLTGEGGGVFPLAVPPARFYFLLETETGRAILSDRHLPMEGGFNFRDLGGICNREGRYVKWGKLIRSDELHGLTDADLDYLSSIPITTIVDFRSEEEIEASADRMPDNLKQRFDFSMNPGNMSEVGNIFGLKSEGIDSLMKQMYVDLVSSETTTTGYRKFFALLQDEANLPLLFHCTAGKDRTGVATALILSALGVDEEIIMENYLESNVYLEDKYGEYAKAFPQLQSLLQVKPEFLQAGIDKIKADYGSVEAYLREVLEVDIPKLQNLYLY